MDAVRVGLGLVATFVVLVLVGVAIPALGGLLRRGVHRMHGRPRPGPAPTGGGLPAWYVGHDRPGGSGPSDCDGSGGSGGGGVAATAGSRSGAGRHVA